MHGCKQLVTRPLTFFLVSDTPGLSGQMHRNSFFWSVTRVRALPALVE